MVYTGLNFQHRATKTEAYLVGKNLSDAAVVTGTISFTSVV